MFVLLLYASVTIFSVCGHFDSKNFGERRALCVEDKSHTSSTYNTHATNTGVGGSSESQTFSANPLLRHLRKRCILKSVYKVEDDSDSIDVLIYNCPTVHPLLPCSTVYLKLDETRSGYLVLCKNDRRDRDKPQRPKQRKATDDDNVAMNESKESNESNDSFLRNLPGFTGLQDVDWSHFRGYW